MTVGQDHASFKTAGENTSGVLEQTPQDNTGQLTSNNLEQHDRDEPESPDTDCENQSDADKPVESAPQDNTARNSSITFEQQDSVAPESPDTDGENQSVVDKPVEPAIPDDPAPRTSTDSALGPQTRRIVTEGQTKERALTEDTFSFLFVTKPWPWTRENGPVLVAGVGIWLLQMAIYFLVLFNSFNNEGSNKLGFPQRVDTPTRIAEVSRLLQSIHRRFTIP
jgi:hypothetical protein